MIQIVRRQAANSPIPKIPSTGLCPSANGPPTVTSRALITIAIATSLVSLSGCKPPKEGKAEPAAVARSAAPEFSPVVAVETCSSSDRSCKYPRDLFEKLPEVKSETIRWFRDGKIEMPAWLLEGVEAPIRHADAGYGPVLITYVCQPHQCGDNHISLLYYKGKVRGGWRLSGPEAKQIWYGNDLSASEKQLLCDGDEQCYDEVNPDSPNYNPQNIADTIIFTSKKAETTVRGFYLDCPPGHSATLLDVLRLASAQAFSRNRAFLLTTVDSRGDEVRIYHQVRTPKGPLNEPHVVMSIDAFGELSLRGISSVAVMNTCLLPKVIDRY